MILPVETEGSLTSNSTVFDCISNALQICSGDSSTLYNATASLFLISH